MFLMAQCIFEITAVKKLCELVDTTQLLRKLQHDIQPERSSSGFFPLSPTVKWRTVIHIS